MRKCGLVFPRVAVYKSSFLFRLCSCVLGCVPLCRVVSSILEFALFFGVFLFAGWFPLSQSVKCTINLFCIKLIFAKVSAQILT